MKNFSSEDSHAKVKSSTRNIAAVPSPERVSSDSRKQIICLPKVDLEEATVPQASGDDHRQLGSIEGLSASACQRSFSEDVLTLDSVKAAGAIEDQNVLYCQYDDSCCISKENDVNMANNDRMVDIDHKNVTSSAASIGIICPAGLDKFRNGQSAACSSSGHDSAEEGNKYSLGAHKDSAEPMLATVDISGSSAPSEAASPRDEPISAKGLASKCTTEPVESSPAKVMDCNILGHIFSENCGVTMKPEAGFHDGKSSDGSEHLKDNSPIRNVQNTREPLSQGLTVADDDGTDELVDVRVCDICGDVGREAQLALCSKCSDGAEHIYCMRIKMDSVPDGDWMCEECMGMQEPKRPKLDEAYRSDHPSNPSYLEDASQGPVKRDSGVRYADEMKAQHSCKASCLSSKRPGSDIEVGRVPKSRILEGSVQPMKSSGCVRKPQLCQASLPNIMEKGKYEARSFSFSGQSTKKVIDEACSSPGHRSPKLGSDRELKTAQKSTLEKIVQPLNRSGSGGKMLLTRVSSMKIVDKGKVAARRAFSIGHLSAKEVLEQQYPSRGHGSPRSQPQLRGGKLCKSKSINIPNSNKEVRWQNKDIHPDQSAKKTADTTFKKKCPDRNLSKSVSFSDVNSVPPNVSNARFYHTKQDLRYGNGSCPQFGPPVAAPDGMKVNTYSTKVGTDTPYSLRNNVPKMKAIQSNGKSKEKPCGPAAYQGKNCAKTSVARSIGETVSPSHSSGGFLSPPKNDSYSDQKAIQSPQKPEIECSSGVDEGHLVASDKLLLTNLHPTKEMHTFTPGAVVSIGISAVPESEFIWKGAFKLENGCKLPNECSGIQAHLSTCAASKAVDLVRKFHPNLLLKEVSRLETWPIQFQRNLPTEEDIAVYFFAEDFESYSRSYKMVLEGMIEHDLALEADFNGVQLLVFPSSLLPVRSQRWNALSFLWGVFRVRKVDNSILHCPSLNIASLNEGSLDPMVCQSSPSTRSVDRSFKHELASLEKFLNSQETENVHCKVDCISPADDVTEKERFSGSMQRNDEKKEDRCITPYTKSLSKVNTLLPEQPDGENMVYLAVDPDANYKDPSLTWQGDKKPDVASGSSFSVDSGPSGSSDGGGCTKLDEGQVEQSQNPANYNALNLDLSLGTGSETIGEIDLNLDLVLGFSQPNKYQPKHYAKDGNKDGNNLLVLSLGMPC